MDTTFELVRSTRSWLNGRKESFREIYDLAVNDVYFQLQFVMCDDRNITNEIEHFFLNMSKSVFILDKADNVAEWINEMALSQTYEWMTANRTEMVNAERRGMYPVPAPSNTYVSGSEMEDTEYKKVLSSYLCDLPELHRQTAMAYYFANLSEDKILDVLMLDKNTFKNRISYIEITLSNKVREYCKENGYMVNPADSRRIRAALFDLAKLYDYPYKNELFDLIMSKL